MELYNYRLQSCVISRLVMCLALVTGAMSHTEEDIVQGPSRGITAKPLTQDLKLKAFTALINSMLDASAYDRQLRPDFGGPPLEIEVNMNVRSMGPVSEVDSTFQLDCYFRQYWYDRRLSFSREKYNGSMLLSTRVLKKMWSPDTYIRNGKGSYIHEITVDNMYIRIDPDGKISFSQRLTIKSICLMDLMMYPLDTQTCKIIISSFGYKNEDVILRWKTGDNSSVVITENITMSQFKLLYTTVDSYNDYRFEDEDDIVSVLETSFILKRETGYYLLNIYVPCAMLVAMSWVTFWLNREASAARIYLGITTFLTTITIGMSGRSDLPELHYITALDLYILMSLFYVLAAFFEYAGVNYFTKITKPDDCKPIYAFEPDELKPPTPSPTQTMEKQNCLKKFLFCILGDVDYRRKLLATKHEMNSVSGIDMAARMLFPLSFMILNILYYMAYGYRNL